jgi:hypothetical protein
MMPLLVPTQLNQMLINCSLMHNSGRVESSSNQNTVQNYDAKYEALNYGFGLKPGSNEIHCALTCECLYSMHRYHNT